MEMASYYSHELTEQNSKIEDGEEEPELRTSSVVSPPEDEAVTAAESDSDEEDDDEEDFWYLRWSDDRLRRQRKEVEENEDEAREEEEVAAAVPWPRRSGGVGGVMLEGYVEAADGDDQRSSSSVARTKSLTDDDLEELKGCLDLGFGFNYEEIPELCNTLPALELCYSMSQKFLDEQQRSPDRSSAPSSGEVCEHSQSLASAPIANWKISSPGDDPDEVKARLRYWAQTVACTVRLCS